jgi:hypothetical protein
VDRDLRVWHRRTRHQALSRRGSYAVAPRELPWNDTPDRPVRGGMMSAVCRPWLTPSVGGIGSASFLAGVGHEVPTALLASFVTATLGAPAVALRFSAVRPGQLGGWPVGQDTVRL